jgi:hypothetical protein
MNAKIAFAVVVGMTLTWTCDAATQDAQRQNVGAANELAAAEDEPSLAELRKSVADAFFGTQSYDEPSRLTIAEHLPESTFDTGCAGAQAVRRTAFEAFRDAGFEEVAVRVQYPELSLYLVRRQAAKSYIDILLFYFKLEKSGVNCRYTLGQYARTEDETNHRVIGGAQRDSLYRGIRELVAKVETAIRSRTQ